jgi:hypothetical protein
VPRESFSLILLNLGCFILLGGLSTGEKRQGYIIERLHNGAGFCADNKVMQYY